MAWAKSMGTDMRPDEIFQPVAEILANHPAELARMEWAICDAQYMEAQGRAGGASWTNAKAVWDVMWRQLNEIDQASMQLHPWWRLIEAGIARAETEFA